MTLFARLSTTIGLAACLAIGAAVPAGQAAGLSFGFGIGPGMFYSDDEGEDIGGACLSDYLLRKQLTKDGYGDIRLGLANGHHMTVQAKLGNSDYNLDVNSCSGKVLDTRPRGRR